MRAREANAVTGSKPGIMLAALALGSAVMNAARWLALLPCLVAVAACNPSVRGPSAAAPAAVSMAPSRLPGAPVVAATQRPPRVVPRSRDDLDVVDTSTRKVRGFPALSRDGRHVAVAFSPKQGTRVTEEAEGPTDYENPGDYTLYPELLFMVLDARTGDVEREDVLADTAEVNAAQKHGTLPALATRIRARLWAMDQALAAGSYETIASARLVYPADVVVDGLRVTTNEDRLVVESFSGAVRLDISLTPWAGEPMYMSPEFTCVYTPRADRIAIDAARGVAVTVIVQVDNGGDPCVYPGVDHQLKVLRLAP